MREPPVKNTLYWCDSCNIPLIGRTCGCRQEGRAIELLRPYDVRPALSADRERIRDLARERFGDIPLPQIVLLNKAGGLDRNDLVIANGQRFGWLSFDPVAKRYRFDLSAEALPFILPHVTRGIVDLEEVIPAGVLGAHPRIGGKRFEIDGDLPEGTVIVRFRDKYGTAVHQGRFLRVKEINRVTPCTPPDPPWALAIKQNTYHLKNLERNAIRSIRQHMHDRPVANVSFSGGKDSTAVLLLARKAGIQDAFFIDTGIEFPETLEFVSSMGVRVVDKIADFFSASEKAGPPSKDNRWCCKLLKQNPLRMYLSRTGPCVTVQGNRWYESWNRADLELAVQNPLNPMQLNVSPIRHWRALEVFMYLWWQEAPQNPLYDMGIERIGCYPCPAMLESEYHELGRLHPGLAEKWTGFLNRWADQKGLPPEFVSFGLWRWKYLPKKMQALCEEYHLTTRETPDGVTVVASREPGKDTRGAKIPDIPGPVPAVTRPPVPAAPGIPVSEAAGNNVPCDRDGDRGKEDALAERVRGEFSLPGDMVYLDSAGTGLPPGQVLSAILEAEREYRAGAGPAAHRLSAIAGQKYWQAHEKVSSFIGGSRGTLVFSKNVTEAIRIVREGIRAKPGDTVVTSVLEHESGLYHLGRLEQAGVRVKVLPAGDDYVPDIAALGQILSSSEVRLVSMPWVSGVTGSVLPVGEIASLCHDHGALLLVDGTHSMPRRVTNVDNEGADFVCFSGHRMFGPSGIGGLWIRDTGVLEPPSHRIPGKEKTGDMARANHPAYLQYEEGTPNIPGALGLAAATDFLLSSGMANVQRHDMALGLKIIEGLREIPGVTVYAPRAPGTATGIVSFTIGGAAPAEIAQYLDESAGIIAAHGVHGCPLLAEQLGLPEGTVRISTGPYSRGADIDLMFAAVSEIARGL